MTVDRDGLRAVQAPLKERYRAEARAALVTLHAQGVLGEQEVSCSVDTGRALVNAGLHPASGGDSLHACSGDMLLQALVACAGVTLQSVAINRGIEVSGRVLAEGDLDFRGTMGVDREVPVGFTAIRLTFDVQSDADSATLDAVLETTERYCVVLQTIRGAPPVTVQRV
ncbi:MAG: OsmC family protein [Candidatus Dormibacteria bacterium]